MKMGLVVLVRNLLLTLCLCLVLGFMYYAAWKLHLLRWEDPKYDRLGFLLKLDSKLPAELATKYANLSDGACKPGYASALMTAIFPKFSRPAPMFLDDSFRKWARIRDFVPPFGIKGQDNLIKAILSATKEYRLTPALDSLSCRRCIIIGNGGVLANKSLGARIDDYDIVVRLNSAPVKGFERDVGGKTTLRITYPEGAMQRPEEYEKDSLFVLAGFKWQDFKWLKYIVYKEKVVSLARPGPPDLPLAPSPALGRGSLAHEEGVRTGVGALQSSSHEALPNGKQFIAPWVPPELSPLPPQCVLGQGRRPVPSAWWEEGWPASGTSSPLSVWPESPALGVSQRSNLRCLTCDRNRMLLLLLKMYRV
uniref:ST3 beta-galactoside alpha-2,3-sialyltransferase 3 n=1 Tax=Monodelphis domestica TaxID=13616 RepID=A0A5F8GKE4_MONDO